MRHDVSEEPRQLRSYTTKVTKSMLAKQTRGAVLILLQLRGTVGQLSTTQQAAAPGAADADVERASAAYGVSAPGRRELFFHGHSPHGHSPHSHSPHSHSPQWFSQPPPLPPVAPDWYNGPTSPKTMLAVAWTIFAVAFAVYGSMAALGVACAADKDRGIAGAFLGFVCCLFGLPFFVCLAVWKVPVSYTHLTLPTKRIV